MKGNITKFFLALTLFFPTFAWPYDLPHAQANLASDYATCSAYYMIATEVLRNNSRDPSKAEAAAKNAVSMAVRLSNQEVTSARVSMVTEAMMDEMKRDLSNWAIVVNRYGQPCREITENPVERLQYWLNKDN